MFVATARSRQLLPDSGAFADWATTTTTSSSAAAIRTAGHDDLSLGFNAGPTSATTGGTHPPPTWSNPNNHRGGAAINYNLPSDMGMVGLRDVFVVAPAASFNHHHHDGSSGINLGAPDPINASNAATALGVGMGVGVIPLLTAGHCHNMDDQDMMNSSRGSKNFWQQQQNQPSSHHHHALQYNFSKKAASILDNANINSNSPPCLLQGGGDGGGGGAAGGNNSSASSGGGTATCQDCGNQAKKDCPHRRCRTCCKSRGYDCSTHLKSTWVPAARRRERQLISGAAGVGGGSGSGAGSTGSSSGAKKPRLISSQTTSHTSTSNDTSSSHQDVGFKEALPGQVRAPAVFKCVRVTAVEDGEDEFAYQAVVRINGHVFKGFLYDQGVGEGRDGFPDISELHLGGGNGGRNGGSSSAPIMDPSDVYGGASGGGGGLLGGSSYGNNPIH